MTIAELKKELDKYPEDCEVIFANYYDYVEGLYEVTGARQWGKAVELTSNYIAKVELE